MEDLSEEVTSDRYAYGLAKDKDITDIIKDMRQYNQVIEVLEAFAATFNTGDTYPAYLNESKTLIAKGP